MKTYRYRFTTVALATLLALIPSVTRADKGVIGPFNTVSTIVSTVPANGDVNPYGVAIVPLTMGLLTQGNILVSNFNNSANLQGTGSTIVQITPSGTVTLFAQISRSGLPGPCPGGIGLTSALTTLSSGWVIVGSLPTRDGTVATAKAGCLLVLDSTGAVRETIASGPINISCWRRGAVRPGRRTG